MHAGEKEDVYIVSLSELLLHFNNNKIHQITDILDFLSKNNLLNQVLYFLRFSYIYYLPLQFGLHAAVLSFPVCSFPLLGKLILLVWECFPTALDFFLIGF